MPRQGGADAGAGGAVAGAGARPPTEKPYRRRASAPQAPQGAEAGGGDGNRNPVTAPQPGQR